MKRIKLKKRKNKLRIRRKLVLISTLVLFLVIGIGYSVLSVNLNILGNITVRKTYGKTLYEVLEKEAAIGTYAKEYTGEHHDSFTVSEMNLLNNGNLRKTGQSYWLSSPESFRGGTYGGYSFHFAIDDYDGRLFLMDNVSYGVRPAISLRPGTEYNSGTGSKDDPYIVHTFQDDDWDTIVNNVRNGNTDDYNVGDTKTVDMGSFGTHTLRIANKSTPSECNNSGFSQTGCGFVLEFSDIISEHRMNSSDTNVGGWPASEMRSYLNSEIYNALPSDLKNIIINTKVISNFGSDDTSDFTSTDKLFLFNRKEIYNMDYGNISNYSRQLDYYGINGSFLLDSNYPSAIKKYNNTPLEWWTRLCAESNNSTWYYVELDGSYNKNDQGSIIHGVSPAFRIG